MFILSITIAFPIITAAPYLNRRPFCAPVFRDAPIAPSSCPPNPHLPCTFDNRAAPWPALNSCGTSAFPASPVAPPVCWPWRRRRTADRRTTLTGRRRGRGRQQDPPRAEPPSARRPRPTAGSRTESGPWRAPAGRAPAAAASSCHRRCCTWK